MNFSTRAHGFGRSSSPIRNALALVAASLLTSCSLPSDDVLRAQFHAHRAVIDQILEMQRHDQKVVRIAPTFTRLENWSWPTEEIGFSQERWDKYRSLFTESGITDGIQNDGDYIWFYVASQGASIGGSTRGFVYTKHVPTGVVTKFDECPRQEGICYIPVEENWYLFQWIT